MNRLALPLLALALVFCGCRKPLPSPDFLEASGRYTNLLALHDDEAYAMSEMDDLVAQLGRVSEKSSDADAARALVGTISKERARIAAEKSKPVAADVPVPSPSFPPLPGSESDPVGAALNPVEAELVRGAAWAPLQKKFFGCVVSRGTISLAAADGGNVRDTEGWELYDSADCKAKVPSLVQNVAMVHEGKVVQIMPKSAVRSAPEPAAVGVDAGK